MVAICPRWGCLKKRAGKNREVSLKRPGVLTKPSKKEPKIRKSQCGWGFSENWDMADREKGKGKRPLFGSRL